MKPNPSSSIEQHKHVSICVCIIMKLDLEKTHTVCEFKSRRTQKEEALTKKLCFYSTNYYHIIRTSFLYV